MRKQLIILSAVTVALFSLAIAAWLNSPTLKVERESMRQQARVILIQTYYYPEVTADTRSEWLAKYRLTDEDINPERILLKVANEAD